MRLIRYFDRATNRSMRPERSRRRLIEDVGLTGNLDMDDASFWKAVESADRAAPGDMDSMCSMLQQELSRRACPDVQEFAAFFDELMDASSHWPAVY